MKKISLYTVFLILFVLAAIWFWPSKKMSTPTPVGMPPPPPAYEDRVIKIDPDKPTASGAVRGAKDDSKDE